MSDFIKYANSFQAIARLRLESITALLEILGNPQKNLNFIHVAGTNGKGSVCAFLQNILSLSGMKCGRYTSPNMIDVCERINIDGDNIPPNDMERILSYVKSAAEEVCKKFGEGPTPFEIWTAAAFCYFNEKKCDMVVLETGLGGTRDATNVIPAPKIAVITRIAMDHTEYLGGTLSEIAAAKAGIIKSDGAVVTLKQSDEIMQVIKRRCEECACPLFVAGEAESEGFDKIYEKFSYGDTNNIVCGLGGVNQIENAVLAVECAKILGISDAVIRRGIAKAKNMGRFEIVSEKPLIIFDGAHNKNGMAALAKSLKRYFEGRDITFVSGVMADKKYGEMLDVLRENGYGKIRTVTVKNNPRALEAEAFAAAARERGFEAKGYESINAALENPGEVTVICGSLYLYKDFAEETEYLKK